MSCVDEAVLQRLTDVLGRQASHGGHHVAREGPHTQRPCVLAAPPVVLRPARQRLRGEHRCAGAAPGHGTLSKPSCLQPRCRLATSAQGDRRAYGPTPGWSECRARLAAHLTLRYRGGSHSFFYSLQIRKRVPTSDQACPEFPDTSQQTQDQILSLVCKPAPFLPSPSPPSSWQGLDPQPLATRPCSSAQDPGIPSWRHQSSTTALHWWPRSQALRPHSPRARSPWCIWERSEQAAPSHRHFCVSRALHNLRAGVRDACPYACPSPRELLS